MRHGRNLFLLFLGATFLALMAGVPLVVAQTPEKREPAAKSAAQGASAPTQEHAGFEQADRNKDGLLDKSESGAIPGLSANFERVDRNKDGKLDKAEFERGLHALQVRR